MNKMNISLIAIAGALALCLCATRATVIQAESSSWSNLKAGETLSFDKFELKVVSCGVAAQLPSGKQSAPTGQHYLLLTLKVTKLAPDAEVNSAQFVATTQAGTTFTTPGAWGKIKLGGGLSDFLATEGSAMYIRTLNEDLNLYFALPTDVLAEHIRITYSTTP
jgi:hypothetical protein